MLAKTAAAAAAAPRLAVPAADEEVRRWQPHTPRTEQERTHLTGWPAVAGIGMSSSSSALMSTVLM